MSSDDISVRIEEHVAFKVCGKKVWISGQDNSQFERFWKEAHVSGMVQRLKEATNPSENVTGSDILGVSCVEKDSVEFWLPITK